MKRFFLFSLVSLVVLSLLVAACPAWAKAPRVLIKTLQDSHKMTAGGGFSVTELIHPRNDRVNPGFSLAYISLSPGGKTKPHYLRTSSQVFYITRGTAILHLDGKSYRVHPGTAIYLAPGVTSWAENNGKRDFSFVCVVCPPWQGKEEVVK